MYYCWLKFNCVSSRLCSGPAGGAGSVLWSRPRYDDGSEAAHVRPAAVHCISGPHAAGWVRTHAGPQLPRHDGTDGAEAGIPHAPCAGKTRTQAHRGRPQPTQYTQTAASTQATSTAGKKKTLKHFSK